MDESVSAAMDGYAMKGWTTLNDGCPDCNTPLMRNQEATSQVCVNCEINPPVDSDEEEAIETIAPEQQQQTSSEDLPSLDDHPQPDETENTPTPSNDLPSFIANLTLPPHLTSPLPALPAPGPIRPPHISQRASVLDPTDPSKKIYRWPSGRIIGTTGSGSPTSTEPRSPTSRSPTPLPNPPKTPTPRPPLGAPPTTPLSPPPTTAPARTPRDKRRSPQNSVIVPGSILPPASPLPRKLAMSTPTSPSNRTSLPTPPTSSTLPSPEYLSYQSAQNFVNGEATTESDEETAEGTQIRSKDEDGTKERALKPSPSEFEGDGATSVHASGDPSDNSIDEEEDEEDDEDLEMESHDEFLDAEEFHRPMSMVSSRSTRSMVSARSTLSSSTNSMAESVRVQQQPKGENERATRLIGQKMLEGWAMLQDPCPNPGCNEVTLIQSPDNRDYCVVCEQFFDDDLPSSAANTMHATKSKRNSPSFALSSSFTSNHTLINSSTFSFPSPPSTLPSTPIPSSSSRSTSSPATMSPPLTSQYRVTSPISSPSQGRATREAYGRISSSIILPPQVAPMSPSFGMTSHQILSRHLSEDMDKLTSEDEEARRHIQLIGKMNDFSSRSLPPVPPMPTAATSSRPASTYSNNSSDGNTNGTKDLHHHRSHRHHQHTPSNATSVSGSFPSPSPAWPSPAPMSPEVQAIVTATHKTIGTLVVKLETYRQALEVTENLKECQSLTAQIKGMMECLKACRDTLDASSIGQSQYQQVPLSPPQQQQSHYHLHNQFPSPPMSPPYPPSQPKEGSRAIKSLQIHLPSPPPLPLPQTPSN
ncbi:hypothetical protein BGZ59_006588 [Podila verticillata]|nr:hypothetical protein BGZ59_006588 [Podila verticillata]KFH74102.1 hypothetical protein MVEG_01315 [Podila verticillata NRRL 6337]